MRRVVLASSLVEVPEPPCCYGRKPEKKTELDYCVVESESVLPSTFNRVS